jgi:transcriptional regulator with XRE-family HTH domain
MIKLYENIKSRRIDLKMTQSELAAKVGYADKGMISRVENGKINLSQSLLIKFAEALETTPGELLGWTESPVSIERNAIAPNQYYIIPNDNNIKELIEVAKRSKTEDVKMATEFLKRLNGD